MGINPKDLRMDEQIAISFTDNYMDDKQKQEKRNFHLLSQDIVDTYNESKGNPMIQAQAIKMSNEYNDKQQDDMDYDI